MNKILILSTILLLGIVNIFAQYGDPQIAGQDKFVSDVQFLEANPLDKSAVETRKWALTFANNINSPFCFNVANLFYAKEIRGEVFAQYLMKISAFHLEKAGDEYDSNFAQVAGLESAMIVYQKILKTDKTIKHKTLDKLLLLKEQGQLLKFVKSAKCK